MSQMDPSDRTHSPKRNEEEKASHSPPVDPMGIVFIARVVEYRHVDRVRKEDGDIQ